MINFRITPIRSPWDASTPQAGKHSYISEKRLHVLMCFLCLICSS